MGNSTKPPSKLFRPFIAAEVKLRELTPVPLILGTLLGIVFGASSLYLVLKTGLTVSASIPVAVISITIFRLLAKMGLKNATILENNIVQTAGSAGESIAFGFGATMPAIMILGFNLEILNVMLVGVLGGLLGILMMIPLRRALIVQQHGILKYPEGTACAEVLKAGADEESMQAAIASGSESEVSKTKIGAKTIFTGFGIGLLYKSAMSAFRLWKEVPEKIFGAPFKSGSVSAEISPELLGVGYIIGPYIAGLMVGGGILAYLVLIPAIQFFGGALQAPLDPGTKLISEMGPDEIRSAYVLYIGAGSVAAAGIISVFRSIPVIWSSIRSGLRDITGSKASSENASRTEQDIPIKWVIVGIVALMVLIVSFRSLQMNFLGALMIVLFGFVFVTVSSRLTGEVGSSSNPVSGMTYATLLLTCLIFLIIGWTSPVYYVTALSVGAIVCIACSNGGTTSQDLKTGFLIGATPKYQQIAILFGSLASAIVLGPILLRLNDNGTVYMPVKATTELHANVAELKEREPIKGAQADGNSYLVWHHTDQNGETKKYLVNDQGTPIYLVDPGINGSFKTRPDGSSVPKFDAPKAVLVSYIIKGILNQKLPWGLVLLGVMITVFLECAGVPSLAFAVGVYLPISTSMPIFIGGLVRWGVDAYLRKKLASQNLSEDEFNAQADQSPGVLMASGYIAGGAIAGIIIAFLAGVLTDTDDKISKWANAANPFFAGDYSNLLSVIPFIILIVLLYLTGREKILQN
jgi:putative OPT family oligopeptide transporter